LLAYYVASVNIENSYHAAMGEGSAYRPFKGIRHTDTFQLYDSISAEIYAKAPLGKNTHRLNDHKNTPIQVIIGNPPYRVGQKSANDNAKNQAYPALDKKISQTYAEKSTAQSKAALYDSYVKAFRWASDRLGQGGGIIGFVSNGGWIDGNSMDGMRKCFAEEFSKIYVFNLRGNGRTSGELWQKEGRNVFGDGSRATIAITVLVKNPNHKGLAEIYHHDIGDYLTREQKLNIVAEKHDIHNPGLVWHRIAPNQAGDWLNQRKDSFKEFISLGDKKDLEDKSTFFKPFYSLGLETGRDPWCYNSSVEILRKNINKTIQCYEYHRNNFVINEKVELKNLVREINYDKKEIKWSSRLINNLYLNKKANYFDQNMLMSLYRPFFKQYVYFDNIFNHRVGQMPKIFPTKIHDNLPICLPGPGGTQEFMPLISQHLPDIHLNGNSQCFPRYHYEEDTKKNARFVPDQTIDGYVRRDCLTDYIYQECLKKYGPEVTKDDIFYYVYGLMHSKDYRREFSADLKKTLPRVPLVEGSGDFMAFSKAGRELADLHLNYETIEPYGDLRIAGAEKGNFLVDKIRFAGKGDKTTIVYNRDITISGIPLAAYEYVVGGRSPIEWILDRYRVKIDRDSGLKNDPNDWAIERGQPRYVLDLISRVITVSLETMKIVKGLPRLRF
ncbi:MAG: helicase, partial [Deltaproteobacteria bacterium]|jgi:predicted helicase|nr:helicase [Deltaproteobacteria bacterium]